MSPDSVIDKLAIELNSKLDCNRLQLINQYMSYGVVYGLEQRAIYKSENLLMLGKFNNEIKRFDRLKDAVSYIFELKLKKTKKNTIERQIGMCISGYRNSAYSYHWRYENK